MISLDLNKLTQAMVDEAMPHLGECTYTAPCLIGAMMTPDERQILAQTHNNTLPVNMLCQVQFPDRTQLATANQIQLAFDRSNISRLRELLPHLEFNQP